MFLKQGTPGNSSNRTAVVYPLCEGILQSFKEVSFFCLLVPATLGLRECSDYLITLGAFVLAMFQLLRMNDSINKHPLFILGFCMLSCTVSEKNINTLTLCCLCLVLVFFTVLSARETSQDKETCFVCESVKSTKFVAATA